MKDELLKAYDKIEELEKKLAVAVHALEHTSDFCLCDRNTNGFDYSELHPHMGKPKPGARWLTPCVVAEEALSKIRGEK